MLDNGNFKVAGDLAIVFLNKIALTKGKDFPVDLHKKILSLTYILAPDCRKLLDQSTDLYVVLQPMSHVS